MCGVAQFRVPEEVSNPTPPAPRKASMSGADAAVLSGAAATANSVEIVPSHGDADGSKMKEYEAMYQYSITRPEEFWAKEAMVRPLAACLAPPDAPAPARAAPPRVGFPGLSGVWRLAQERLSWVRPFDTIKSGKLEDGNMSWFTNGQINACYQCCDRHDPEKIAITWEGNEVRQLSRFPRRSRARAQGGRDPLTSAVPRAADRHPPDHVRRDGTSPRPPRSPRHGVRLR